LAVVLVLALSLGVVFVLFVLTLCVPLDTISIPIALITGGIEITVVIEITVEHPFPDRLSITILAIIPIGKRIRIPTWTLSWRLTVSGIMIVILRLLLLVVVLPPLMLVLILVLLLLSE
jgi:hypothetical protein